MRNGCPSRIACRAASNGSLLNLALRQGVFINNDHGAIIPCIRHYYWQ
jgi:hypothetical protein